ncbi:hypothetical protein PR048_016169 [Dryococelus australis]|uniref:Uncharacterized protein n=1 Tax=Dryococelus australis TaxID=614101 RepID=A0ABQ9HJ02_9NEOP|nr:hypothetical protein PR048_016169 [Dryococelus australis]
MLAPQFLRCMVTHKYWSQIIFHSIPGNLGILQRIDLNFSLAAQDMRRAMDWQKMVMHIAKQLLCKCWETDTDYREALQEYQNTPIPGIGVSPSQLLNSRLVRIGLPLSMDKRKPRVQEGVHEWLKHREKKTRQWYNQTSDRKYIAFKSGQNVVERTSQDKSYLVQNYRGNVIRGTSKDLRPSYNHHAPVKNYRDLSTVSGDVNMRVDGDIDSSEKIISTMHDAVERDST